ncbi:MAG: 23S rRNA (uracil(1939)-C(5))-methyltransferase RlmD [Candidatus Binatia bacterium]
MKGPGSPTPALPCPHFPNCVGCVFIGHAYGEQLQLKHQRVREAFSQFPSLAELPIPPLIGSPRAFGYRNQAKLVTRGTRSGLLLGIYRPQSHQVVDISQCPVHHPLINRVLAKVRETLERLTIPIYDERTHAGTVRYVVVRVSNWTRRAQIILVTRDQALPRARELVAQLQRIAGVVSVVQNVNPDPGNVIFGRTFVPLTRESALIERIGFLKLKTHAGAFLQANIALARKLYEHVVKLSEVGADDVCVDLYCGVGALTFHLAAVAKHVTGIEESDIAVVDAKANIRLNGYHNVRFHCGDVATALPAIAQRLGRIDVVALNPPRKGTDVATRTAIVACAPRRITYVSCDPFTLARDLDWFAAHQYRPTRVQPFDLLPQTEHVECVAALAREG